MKNLFFFLAVFLTFTSIVFGQSCPTNVDPTKSYTWPTHSNWYYGKGNLLNFGSSGTAAGTDGNLTGTNDYTSYESVASASDESGKLVFSTNGYYLWDENGVEITIPGGGLKTGPEHPLGATGSAVQGVLIVRHPLDTANFYIFTTDDAISGQVNAKNPTPYTIGFNYFVYNKVAKSCTGATRLGNYRSTEQVAATWHENGIDIWIASHESVPIGTLKPNFTQRYNTYLLECGGLLKTSAGSADSVTTSDLGYKVTAGVDWTGAVDRSNERASLEFSWDGTKAAATHHKGNGDVSGNDECVSTMTFNNLAGTFTNSQKINVDDVMHSNPYDCEFSPSNNRLFVSYQGNPWEVPALIGRVEYFNLGGGAPTVVGSLTSTIDAGCIKVGGDGEMYVAQFVLSPWAYRSNLIKISNPDGAASWDATAISPGASTVGYGLPNMFIPPRDWLKIVQPVGVTECAPYDIETNWVCKASDAENTSRYESAYEIISGDGTINDTTGLFSANTAGTFKVAFVICTISDTVEFVVTSCNCDAELKPGPVTICAGENVMLDSLLVEASSKGTWTIDTIVVGTGDAPTLSVLGTDTLFNTTVTTIPGTYKLNFKIDGETCEDSIYIVVNPAPIIDAITNICAGSSFGLTLDAAFATAGGLSIWSIDSSPTGVGDAPVLSEVSPGDTSFVTTATSKGGTYKIMNTSTGGCKDSSYITVNQLPVVTPLTNLCAGESASLAINAAFAISGGISVWSIDSSPAGVGDAPVLNEVSPGDTSFVTTATSKAGTYKIMNTSTGGCKDSTYIIVNPVPDVTPLTSICAGESASLALNAAFAASGGISVWSIDSSPTGVGDAPVLSEVSPGDTSFVTTATSKAGTYKIMNTSAGGCKDSTYIIVNQAPVVAPLTNICLGENASLVLSATVGVSVWSIDSIPTGTGGFPTIEEVSPGDTSFISTSTSRPGTYKIINTSLPGGCKDSVYITVNSLPVITPLTNVCAGETANLTINAAFIADGGVSVWSIDSTPTGTGSIPTIVEVSPGDTSFISTATSRAGTYKILNTSIPGGCKDSVYITVNPVPVVTQLTNICAGESAGLSVDATFIAAGGVSVWSIDSVPTGTGDVPTIAEVSPGDTSFITTITSKAGTYKILNVSVPGGCKDSTYIIVNPKKDATITTTTGNDTLTLCEKDPDDPQVTVAETGGTWNNINVTMPFGSTTATIDLSAIKPVTDLMLIYKFDAPEPCPDADTIWITTTSILDASILAMMDYCISDTTSYVLTKSATANDGGTWWVNGVENPAKIFKPSLLPAGTYSIEQRIGGLCGDTDTVSVMIYPLAVADITGDATLCRYDDAITLSADSTSITWKEIDGKVGFNTGTLVFNPLTAASGVHQIEHTVSNAQCSDVDTAWVTVIDTAVIAIGSFGPYCANGSAVVITATDTSTPDTSGAWIPSAYLTAGGSFDPTLANVGKNAVKYTVGIACPVTEIDSIEVLLNENANIPAYPGLCSQDPAISVIGTSGELLSTTVGVYTPVTGYDVTSNMFDPVVAGVGTHKILYTLGDLQMCGDSASTTIKVTAAAIITPTNPVDRCVGDITTPSTFLASVGTATGTGVWSLNAPALGSINPNTGVWSGTGVTAGGKVYATYTFTTTDPAPNGCVSSALDSLEVFDNPVIDFSRENEDSCVAYADVFTDNTVYSLAALSGSTWDFGNGATGTNQGSDGTNYTVAGEYTVTLSNEYANGCEATADTVINVFPLPTADFVWSPNPVSVLDPRIQFTNSGDLTDEFLWDFTSKGSPVTSASIMPSTVFSVLGDDTIPVTLIVTNNFMASTGATVGCTDTVIKNVIIQDIFQLYVPNAFTPGTKSDGLNDTFYPKGRNWALDNYEFLVLDRWGNLIFQTTTIGHGWDGTVDGSASSGRLSQNDVYVWKLTVKNMYTGKVYRKVGTVTLVK